MPTAPKWERATAITAGLAFLLALLAIATLIPSPTPFQEFVFRVVLAIAAAAFGSTIPGLLEINIGHGTQMAIRAAGALALFVAVFLVNPPKLLTTPVPEPAPTTPTTRVGSANPITGSPVAAQVAAPPIQPSDALSSAQPKGKRIAAATQPPKRQTFKCGYQINAALGAKRHTAVPMKSSSRDSANEECRRICLDSLQTLTDCELQ
jgi:hypothetical protein